MKLSGMIAKDRTSDDFSLLNILKCVGIAAAVTVVLLIVFAFIIVYTSFPEDKTGIAVVVSMIIGNLVGGWIMAGSTGSNGWMNGGIAGAAYMLVIFVIGGILSGFAVSLNTFVMVITGIASGAVGGIFGVNFSHRR